MIELAVILPTFKERKNLAPMVARLDAALAGIAWEAIFVDDNSPDGTSDEARAISQQDARIRPSRMSNRSRSRSPSYCSSWPVSSCARSPPWANSIPASRTKT